MAKSKADLVTQLSVGKSKAEIAALEGMSRAELQELAGETDDEDANEVAQKQDETVPGGDFIVDGRHVNSEGKELGKPDKK